MVSAGGSRSETTLVGSGVPDLEGAGEGDSKGEKEAIGSSKL